MAMPEKTTPDLLTPKYPNRGSRDMTKQERFWQSVRIGIFVVATIGLLVWQVSNRF